ncbi:MAG: peptidoglycan recognition family protein, partial [bacterium]|nr:peptidoglycan recognition family protein [bacterium]
LSIQQKIFKNLEHGALKKVNGIVLHQTDSSSAAATLRAYQTQKNGAHYLIDCDGTIYQTASLEQKVWHVGKLQPRCKNEGTCSEEERKAIAALEAKPVSYGRRATLISRHEAKKAYPERYPSNADSIGIEVVGLHDEKKGYGPPTKKQKESLDRLVNALLEKYNLTLKDVYAHGRIGRKMESEAIHLGY